MKLIPVILCFLLFTVAKAQNFKKIPLDSFGVKIYDIESAEEGSLKIVSSVGLWSVKGRQVDGPSYLTSGDFKWKRLRDFPAEAGIKALHAAKDSLIFYATRDNILLFFFADKGVGMGFPPFIFPPKNHVGNVTSLWSDLKKNLYVGCSDGFYLIEEGAHKWKWDYTIKLVNNDSDLVIDKGAKEMKFVKLSPKMIVNCFAQDNLDKDLVWVGTNRGIYKFKVSTGNLIKAHFENNLEAITALYSETNGDIWFGTEKKGMGLWKSGDRNATHFTYINSPSDITVKAFCKKTDHEFFVAVADSLPAIFNKHNHRYKFIKDSLFEKADNNTTDIETDVNSNVFVLNNGKLYYVKTKPNTDLSYDYVVDRKLLSPYITNIEFLNGVDITELIVIEEGRKTLRLPHDKNSFFIFYDVVDSKEDDVKFAWTIKGYMERWAEMSLKNFDSAKVALADQLPPGTYEFIVKVKVGNEDWRKEQETLTIIIDPPFWKTWWFWTAAIGLFGLLIYAILKIKIASVRKHEREKAAHEKELLELEARALRAQMNPHFIYNCLNSIKALIQNDDKPHSIEYLTTFSKLMRTLFHNSDKRQISLYDEIECCKLYTKLETMRLNDKLQYDFELDPNVDLKSIMVPALIIQPFIENAIWHGLVPKEGGRISVRVKGMGNTVTCEVEDDGIGREMSRKNKPLTPVLHESKGVHLSQARIDLQKKLTETDASIEIIDKYDQNRPTGTRVILSFNLS